MKISKVACMAILVSAINVGAFADVENLDSIYNAFLEAEATGKTTAQMHLELLKEIAKASADELANNEAVVSFLSKDLKNSYNKINKDSSISSDEKKSVFTDVTSKVESLIDSGKVNDSVSSAIKTQTNSLKIKPNKMGM